MNILSYVQEQHTAGFSVAVWALLYSTWPFCLLKNDTSCRWMMLVGNQSSLETLMVSINRRQFRVVSRMWHTLRKTHLQPVNNPKNCHTHDMLTPRAYMRDYSVQPSFPWLGHHQIPSKFPQGILVAPLVLVTVRATGHKTPGESSVNITVCNYNTTHLQENPQLILQFAIIIQLTSRRILRD